MGQEKFESNPSTLGFDSEGNRIIKIEKTETPMDSLGKDSVVEGEKGKTEEDYRQYFVELLKENYVKAMKELRRAADVNHRGVIVEKLAAERLLKDIEKGVEVG